MVFSSGEIEKLGFLNRTAELCNIFFNNNDLNGSEFDIFVDYKKDDFILDFKKFIFELDLRLIESDVAVDLVKSAVKKLNDDLENVMINKDFDHSYANFILCFIRFFSTPLSGMVGGNSVNDILDYFSQDFRGFYVKIRSIASRYYKLNDKKIDLNNSLVILEDKIKKLSLRLDAQEKILKNEAKDSLNPIIGNLVKDTNDISDKFKSELLKIQAVSISNLKEQVEKLENDINDTNHDFKASYKDYDTLKKMINLKGELQVTDHYKNRAFWERITYWFMTTGTFSIIILSICLALKGLDEYKQQTSVSVSELIEKYKDQPVDKIEKLYSAAQNHALIYLILRLLFSVLLFSSIIYTSRVAYRAYIHMRHSENMMLKLATLRPFINQLDEAERNQIHKDLVPDYFGKDAGMVDGVNEKFKDLPANVSAVAMKAIEQIGSGGGNSEGKNDKKEEA